ncbi:outer envelope membrane protein 7 [Arachis duranensis]|uniref:Outer envelope membrane protein 7 n=1 Tax=Arachis duranensis TaxID=130453 RepID=A0A6P4DUH0_ARADU|nr:outer envelope membrane protein 7 [Arachis duranensis]
MGKAKDAVVVVGALALAWAAIELALKPFLSKARSDIDKSDPARDPDDDAVPSAEPKPLDPPAPPAPDA